MTTIEMNLPASYSIASRGTGVTLDVSALSVDILTKLVLHGLDQKVGDAAASALADAGFGGRKFADLTDAEKNAVRQNAKASMQKVVDALVSGEWGVERTGGAGVDPAVAERRTLLRPDVKAAWIAENDAAGWKALDEADIVKLCDELFDGQDVDTQAAIMGVVEARMEAKAAAKKAASGLAGLIKMPGKK